MSSNVAELDELTRLAAEPQVSRLLVSNVLPYTGSFCRKESVHSTLAPPLQTNSRPLRVGAGHLGHL
jgi:hypothetical protein